LNGTVAVWPTASFAPALVIPPAVVVAPPAEVDCVAPPGPDELELAELLPQPATARAIDAAHSDIGERTLPILGPFPSLRRRLVAGRSATLLSRSERGKESRPNPPRQPEWVSRPTGLAAESGGLYAEGSA
jgi:hypothetical protein